MQSILFIHRSVGANMLRDTQARSQGLAYNLYDFNANTNLLVNPDGMNEESSLFILNGDTNPRGLNLFFEKALTDRDTKSELEKFDVIVFKSCYTASRIQSDDMLASYKKDYQAGIDSYIQANPSKRFVVVSPPPRRNILTRKSDAERAANFSDWLRNFVLERENCSFLDFFRILSDSTNTLARSYRRTNPFDQHPNRRGSQEMMMGFNEELERLAAIDSRLP